MPRSLKHPAVATALFAQGVFAMLWLVVWSGGLAWAELLAYDSMLVQQAAVPGEKKAPIVLIGASDADVEALNWPVTDQILADLLQNIQKGGPKAIGVDLYRGEPEGAGGAKLTEILSGADNIFMIYKFADQSGFGIPAPDVAQQSGRVGFADHVVDPGGIVRRGLLFLEDSKGESGLGLGLQLAARVLADKDICMQSDGSEANNVAFGPCPKSADEAAPDPARLVVIPPFEENDGGYVGADARGYQFMIDYRDGLHPFPIFGFRDVVEGRIGPEKFKDSIVLIGVTAKETAKDFFFTPFSRSAAGEQTSFGMEIHGHLISQLLRYGDGTAKPITPMRGWQEAAWLWLWTMLGAVVGYRVRSPWSLAARIGVGMLAIFGAAFVALGAFYWMPVATPAVGWLLAAAITTAYMSYHENQNRTALMGLFSQHVSADVAQELWEQRDTFMDGGRPRPQRLVATVLFTDLKGFTSVSEGLEPAALMDWLNEYMTTMSQIISMHGGVIDKFIGDAIMVVFGIPRKRESEADIAGDANAAVACAVTMGHELEVLNAAWRAQDKPVVGMRVGIHTGALVAGALGGADRQNYTVIGDTVNTAARLESYDKSVVDPERPDAACRIIISDITRAYLKDRYETVRVGHVALKGKAQQVEIHVVRMPPESN